MFAYLAVVACALYIVYKYLAGNIENYWQSRGVPVVDLSVFGSKWDRVTQVIPPDQMEKKIYAAAKAQNARFFGLIQNGVPVFIPLELDLIKALCVKDFDYFRNRRILLPPLEFEPLAKISLLAAKDQEWKDLRSIVSPTFSPLKLQEMFPIFNTSFAKLEEFLNSRGKDEEIEFVDVFARYTVDVIASVAFGLESNTFKDSEFFRVATRFQTQFSSVWGRVKLFLTLTCPSIFKLFGISLADKSVFTFFVQTIKDTMAYREKSGEKRQDFLQLLVQSKDSPTALVLGKRLTDQQVYAHCLLFFLGGFESVQSLLNYTTYELALNPDIQEKLYEEIKEVGQGKVDFKSVGQMEYLDRVISGKTMQFCTNMR